MKNSTPTDSQPKTRPNSVGLKVTVQGASAIEAADFLAQQSQLSKALVKKIMIAGGVWWQRQGKGTIQRIRKATFLLEPGDKLEIYYDPTLVWPNPEDSCFAIWDSSTWGIWFKGAGILSEGTRYGDQGSLLRFLEKNKPQVFLVHRLDRETSGPMAFAYNKSTCRYLSELWAQGKVDKRYLARVRGNLKNLKVGMIDFPLEEKTSLTEIEKIDIIQRPDFPDEALLHIKLHTGRYHQIRQHLSMLDCPIIGDPRYGQGNKNETGLELMAYELALIDPRSQTLRQFRVPDSHWPAWAML